MERAGASFVVSPYTTAGQNIADAILRPKLAQFIKSNRTSDIELGEFILSEESPLVGKSVRNVGERFPSVVFVAVRCQSADIPIRPAGSQLFEPKDAVTIAGPRDDVELLYLVAESAAEQVAC